MKVSQTQKKKKRILTGILAIVGVLAIAVTAFLLPNVGRLARSREVSMDREEEIENELFPRLWTSAFSISFLES